MRCERISEMSFSAAELSPASIPSIAALISRHFPSMAFALALVLVFTGRRGGREAPGELWQRCSSDCFHSLASFPVSVASSQLPWYDDKLEME